MTSQESYTDNELDNDVEEGDKNPFQVDQDGHNQSDTLQSKQESQDDIPEENSSDDVEPVKKLGRLRKGRLPDDDGAQIPNSPHSTESRSSPAKQKRRLDEDGVCCYYLIIHHGI